MSAYVYGTTVEHGILELEVTFGFDVAWGDPCDVSVVEGVVILEVEGNAWPCDVGEYNSDELGPALLKWADTHEDKLLAAAEEIAADRNIDD